MKAGILLSLVIMFSAFMPVGAQTNGELRQVTLNILDSRISSTTRFSINFETGKVRESRREFSGDFDLIYGGMSVGWYGKKGKAKVVDVRGRPMPTEWFYDWFQVADPRFMIADLGAKKWADFTETPSFPPSKKTERPQPLENKRYVYATTAESGFLSPYRQAVQAKAEHMYLIRLRRGPKVIYAMFRVESLVSRNKCVLSWKLVPPPKVDNERDDLPIQRP